MTTMTLFYFVTRSGDGYMLTLLAFLAGLLLGAGSTGLLSYAHCADKNRKNRSETPGEKAFNQEHILIADSLQRWKQWGESR